MTALDSVAPPEAWIVTVRRKAHLNQCLALANAAGLHVERTIEIPGTTATDHKFFKIVDVAKACIKCVLLFATVPVPRQKVILSSGRSISLLVWLWKKWAGKAVLSIYVGHAKSPLVFYDMMLIPQHDVPLMMQRRKPEAGVEVVETTGILTHQQRAAFTKNADDVLVCLGGDNISFSYAGAAFLDFLTALEAIQKTHRVRIAFSGRTTKAIRERVMQKANFAATVIEAHDRDGFVAAQRQSASIIVCPDSVSMISEALAMGASVFVPRLEELNTTTSDYLFVADCHAKGYVHEVGEFPTPKRAAVFPDSLAQAVPPVLRKMTQWKRSSI